MKSCQIKGSLFSFQRLKKILILIVPTSIHERSTGDVRDWNVFIETGVTGKFKKLTLLT